MTQNLRPVRRVRETTQVRLLLASENLQSCGFTDSVGAYQTQHLTRSWDRQTVELEGVLGVSVGCFLLEIAREVYYRYRLEWTFLKGKGLVCFRVYQYHEIVNTIEDR